MNSALILMSALSMTGREMDALSLMRRLGGQISDAGEIVGLREKFTGRAYYVLLTAGQWRRCIDLLNPPAARDTHQLPYRSAAAELAAGIAYVYAGRGAVALGFAAVSGSPAGAAAGPGHPPRSLRSCCLRVCTDWQRRAVPEIFGQVAADRGHRRLMPRGASLNSAPTWPAGGWATPTPSHRLKESARRDIAAGRYTLAGISLLGATVHGTEADFRLLEEVAGHRQGPLAEISRLIAVGSRTHDAKTLLAGGELAATLELDAVEARCMALAVDYARQAGDPASARTAQARLDVLAATVASLPIVPSSGSPLLTSRERQIARLAGRGASNRDIALDMGVSVRTVEGHLYQVFTKLGVTSRGDLTGLV